MYLKRLEINGFKSFSEKTVLEFMSPKDERQSITAIVGPNGSGKSNVADAVRWVLGEQGLKLLRAKKSEDLIFSGTAAKGKMGLASVTMVIDNQDGGLPVDYEELIISRRVYRVGESEYLINGHQVRLLDLHLLLAKAQFGQGSYSVIGQGMIDKMLLQTPAERKDFFDEAFGIKEFQIKRHQAELKLKNTRQHIEQADGLLLEVSPRLKSLSRQVKKLQERQEVETELRAAQEAYYLTLGNNNQVQLKRVRMEWAQREEEYKKHSAQLALAQTELTALAREKSREEVYLRLQNEYQQVAQEKNNLGMSLAELSGRMQVEYSRAGKHNVGWLENKIKTQGQERKNIQTQIDELQANISRRREQQNTDKRQLDNLTVERVELRGRLSSLETQLIAAKNEQGFIQAAGLKVIRAVLENKQKFGKVYGTLSQLGEAKGGYQTALDTAAGGHLASLVVADDFVAEVCINFLRQERLGVATFLPLNRIKPKFRPQNLAELTRLPGGHGLALDLIKFADKFAAIFSYVLGGTLVVEDISAARAVGIGKIRMVTLAGDLLEASGAMKGGWLRPKNIGLSFAGGQILASSWDNQFDQAEKIAEVKAQLERVEIKFEQTQKAVLDKKTDVEIDEKKQSFLREQKNNLDSETAALAQELSLSAMSKEEYSEALKNIAFEAEKIDGRIAGLTNKLSGVEAEIKVFHKQEEKKKQRIFALQDATREIQEKLNQVDDAKNEKQIAIAGLDTKQEDLAAEVYQELNVSIESIYKKDGPSVELADLEAAQVLIQKLKYKLSLIGGIDEEVVAEYSQTKQRYDDLDKQLTDLRQALADLEKLAEELDSLMKLRRDKAFKKIKKEFQKYFSVLFDGGKADLIEVVGEAMPDEMIEAEVVTEELVAEPPRRKKKILQGMEITACPPGKKIKDIQALSGGERTLTAIALICAILHVNPPPFSVLDEVEAALDEANTLRFNKILKELSEQSQFILITHNRATMHAADALYGVTMGGGGVSHLLSVKMADLLIPTGTEKNP